MAWFRGGKRAGPGAYLLDVQALGFGPSLRAHNPFRGKRSAADPVVRWRSIIARVIGSVEDADSLIRSSFGRFTSNDEIEFALQPIG